MNSKWFEGARQEGSNPRQREGRNEHPTVPVGQEKEG